MKFLVKSDLPELKILRISNLFFYLEECGIESEGFKHFAKGKWPILSVLNIGYHISSSKICSNKGAKNS